MIRQERNDARIIRCMGNVRHENRISAETFRTIRTRKIEEHEEMFTAYKTAMV